MADINDIRSAALEAITACADEKALEDARVQYLGKKAALSELMKTLGKMSPEERQEKGPLYNGVRAELNDVITAKKAELHKATLDLRLASERVDVTLPPRPLPQGSIHPITQVTDEIIAIFADMGFAVAEGPDIESDYYNFTALNFPEGHPAREMHDTFYMTPDEKGDRKVLRTHTSPVQIRTLEAQNPPVRVIIPGRTYRCDSDQTHTPMFHQVEGLAIDKTTTMGELKWVLAEFCKAFFEVPEAPMRFRPSYFPFTEPSMEVDILCDRSGDNLKIGEGSDWMEILGCGMVHPNVLTNVGLDPNEYQGWAFGMGIDRLAMLKYGIPDLRDFFAADLRWLKHYGFAALDMPNLATGLSR
jgi:phenylalanyl-tRNA synthetase alpha chain